ncbi:hypothetical protein [Streptomyces sp. NPDC048442]|uniref:hypothetical protein n=1 Tax=Streptomyces sp. NPDC048442 TaxID=3154823 RepID=UPI0034194571
MATLATAAALVLTASGCVTVHGEREIVPAATKAEAAQALKDFTDAYNKADKAYDPALVAGRVTGALGAINQAGLKARRTQSPGGNRAHQPLALSDARFLIPKRAGWPRWFVADTDSNRDTEGGDKRADTRWLLVFVRGGADQLWEASHLLTLRKSELPEFAVDGEGWAKTADESTLQVPPQDLSQAYATYLQTPPGKPATSGGLATAFAPGPDTTAWLASRKRASQRVGRSMQYLDQALNTGAFAPVGLATKDGGGFVFFASRHFEKQTAARGVPLLDLNADVRALMTGTAKSTLLKERVSSQVALVPKKGAQGAAGPAVELQSRVQGLVSATGS